MGNAVDTDELIGKTGSGNPLGAASKRIYRHHKVVLATKRKTCVHHLVVVANASKIIKRLRRP